MPDHLKKSQRCREQHRENLKAALHEAYEIYKKSEEEAKNEHL